MKCMIQVGISNVFGLIRSKRREPVCVPMRLFIAERRIRYSLGGTSLCQCTLNQVGTYFETQILPLINRVPVLGMSTVLCYS